MQTTDEREIISQLYAVVESPQRYEAFMQSLQDKIEALPTRDEADDSTPTFIGEHMNRACSLVDIVTPWRLDSDSELHGILAQKMQAMIALDAGGNVIDSNDAANVLYDLTPGATCEALPLDAHDRESLLRIVRETVAHRPARNSPNNVQRFRNRITDRTVLVTVEPYVQRHSGETYAIVRTSDIGWPSYLGSILQDLFDLTRAEVDVLRLMVEGDRVSEIAERRCASVTTIRSQLRSIFAKTDTGSQMDCVRMGFGLSLMHEADEGQLIAARIQAAQDTPLYPRDDQHRLFHLPGGRQIDYSTFGAEDGAPLLFYHCQTWGDVWFREAVDAASEAGFRIIAPLRPGFGQTTLYEGGYSDPRAFAPEIEVLLDHLDVERAPLISVGAGFVHALAAAERMPERLISITATHPWLPVLCNEDYEGFNGFNKLVAHTRLHFPQGLRFLVKAGFAFVSKSGPEAFARALLRDSPHDVEWVTRPDVLPITVHGLKTHRYQGYLGGFGDIANREDWRDLIRDCPVPIRFVIGEHDRNVQWRSARGFAEEHDHVTLSVMRDSGYLVHHQHSDQILRWVQADVNAAGR